jgi:hypothetical protein
VSRVPSVFDCPDCGTRVIRAREVDNNMVLIERAEGGDGRIIGPLNAEPTVMWGDPTTDFVGNPLTNSDRYAKHPWNCTGASR